MTGVQTCALPIFRPRSVTGGSDWATYHASCTNANYVVFINNTKAQTSYPTIFGGTAPTSTVFTAGSGYNGNGLNMIGYGKNKGVLIS